jgi:Na+:H+ antiporter, NhaA family
MTHQTRKLVHFVFDRYLLLPLGAIVALVWVHAAAESYFAFSIRLSFLTNEIAMAIFLGLVTQEIMDATLPGGALHTRRRWTLPIVAAAGGIAGAAAAFLAYVQLKHETVLTMGWPVATTIDIAAAYFLLKLIYRRNSAAYPFLLLIAIATNGFALGAVGVRQFVLDVRPIAMALLIAAVSIASALRLTGIRQFWPYLAICAPMSWLSFYWGGLHPALALVPIVPFLPHRPRGLDLLENGTASVAHTRQIEHEWAYVVQPIVLLFGLVNGGVVFTSYGTGTWALLTAALVGRPVGIMLAVAAAVGLGLKLPRTLGWKDLVVIAMTTSGGFTLALFAATAVFPIGPLLGEAKVGALLTAAGAGIALAVARGLRVGRFGAHRPAVARTHAVPARHVHA